ncbi:flagellar hook-basal body complex protein FliE [Virgibacillus sp. W0181]|uniref:flagellar hook-basal body complex protein FliE n=1 Tax=Virgibacillus sp. W0181 TaxID=3391581 RepID=UPI003F455DC3
MNEAAINRISPGMLMQAQKYGQQEPAESQSKFANVLKSAIHHTNELQQVSNHKTEQLALGKVNDLHDVMISAQKASITLETTVQVQQKVLDAYNEVMRMQV